MIISGMVAIKLIGFTFLLSLQGSLWSLHHLLLKVINIMHYFVKFYDFHLQTHKLQIIQMITIDQLSRHQPSDTQKLDLRSSKQQKIHKIDSLQRFTLLRELNLANNMISRIENLSSLVHLNILNLEFNQISKLQGLKALPRLEELFLSYNCIDTIYAELKFNQGLRVLHLAYNDLKSIEDIRPLSSLSSLSILSLIGNPFLAALNYIAFVKMLIPSLVLLDDRDAGQCIIAANVYPHEEIFILRDALNKLLDERNNEKRGGGQGQMSPQSANSGRKQFTPKRQMASVDGQSVISLLQQWVDAYERKAQTKRLEINDLSESYSQCMKKNTAGKAGEKQEAELLAKINKYRTQEERGQISQEGRARLAKLTKELQKRQEIANQAREQSRGILQMLKGKQGEYAKTRERVQVLKQLKEKVLSSERDANKTLLCHILYGSAHAQELSYKDLKRFLYDDKGLIFYLENLNSIIFGEQADSERINRLKQFLGEKSLIEIINNLKEVGVRHKKERKRYERQRGKLIEQFENQAQELCEQWRELQKQKWLMRNSRNTQQFQSHSKSRSIIEERYSIVEAEQRNRIMMLKKDKEHYEARVDQLQLKYEALQGEFQRKYKELEQFQKFFEEFKNEREIVNGLKEQIQNATQQLHAKKDLLGQLQANVRELSAKQGALLQRSSFYQRKVFQRWEELKLIQQKLRASQQKCKKVNEEFNLRSYQCIGVQDQIAKMAEQLKEYEKRIERQKSTLEIYEQKLRNLSQLQNNKRSNLSTLQADIELQRKHLSQLSRKVQQSQQKLNRCIETSYQYQLKIQQNKKTLQSLTDINKTVADMMERQAQLKRSIFELEMENQHLQEIKARMMNDIKLKYDDQDQNL